MGDYPDWGGFYNNQAFFPSFDMAELAARLGSPITYDRRGAFCWGDIFDGGLQRWEYGGGPGYGVALDPDVFEYGRFSAKLTSNAAINATVSMVRYLNLPLADTLGFSAMYRLGVQDTIIQHKVQVYSEGDHLNARLEIDCDSASPTIKIFDDTSWQMLDSPTYVPVRTSHFTLVKLVIDFVNQKWVRVIVGNNEYDASAYSLSLAGTASHEYVACVVGLKAKLVGGTNGYVDNVIYTANEPL